MLLQIQILAPVMYSQVGPTIEFLVGFKSMFESYHLLIRVERQHIDTTRLLPHTFVPDTSIVVALVLQLEERMHR